MEQIKGKLWIFGGLVNYKSSNDLKVFDLDSMSWMAPIRLEGSTPPARQGHASVKQGLKFIIMGGCNYAINTCYSDAWSFDTVNMKWDNYPNFPEPKNGLSANVIGANIFIIGGLQPN